MNSHLHNTRVKQPVFVESLKPECCSLYVLLAQHEALRQVAAPIGEHLVLARELVRVAVGGVALLRHDLRRVCDSVDRGVGNARVSCVC